MDFFRLPGEICNIVDEELLMYPRMTIRLVRNPEKDRFEWKWTDLKRPSPLVPAIPRLNRQAKLEGSFVLYSRNRFHLKQHDDTEFPGWEHRNLPALFARQIGPYNAALVRVIFTERKHILFEPGRQIRISLDEKGVRKLFPNLEGPW